jgi:lambda repressor-like predicted transcriptional regulator
LNRVAWFRVIADLEQRGITLRSQADIAGVSLGTIYYWKTGGEPKYLNGERLLGAYTEFLGIEPPRLTMPST